MIEFFTELRRELGWPTAIVVLGFAIAGAAIIVVALVRGLAEIGGIV